MPGPPAVRRLNTESRRRKPTTYPTCGTANVPNLTSIRLTRFWTCCHSINVFNTAPVRGNQMYEPNTTAEPGGKASNIASSVSNRSIHSKIPLIKHYRSPLYITYNVMSSTIGPVLAIAIFIVSLYTIANNSTRQILSDPISLAFLTFLISILVDRVADTVRLFKDKEEQDAKHDVLISSIDNAADLQFFSESFFENIYIRERIKLASHVRNTILPFSHSQHHITVGRDSVYEVYKDFFEGVGEKWVDVVVISEFFQGRFRRLYDKITPLDRRFNPSLTVALI